MSYKTLGYKIPFGCQDELVITMISCLDFSSIGVVSSDIIY